jgi:hypothetical protein
VDPAPRQNTFGGKKFIVVLQHPIHSSDLVPYDLSPTIMNHLEGSHFETMEEIKVIMAILKFAGDNYFEENHCTSE